jgi:hypothetical protein
MKFGFQNYTVIIPINNSYIKFNNNKINSVQIYNIAQNYRILHKIVHPVSQRKLTISKYRHIQKLRHRKQYDSSKRCRYVHNFQYTKLNLSDCNGL